MKFLLDNLLFIALILISGGMLLWPVLRRAPNRLSTSEATRMINQGAKTLVIDVRDSKAYAEGHLPEARSMPLKELSGRVGELGKFKNRNVIVICQSGKQSAAASAVLSKAGFEQVFSIEGGVAGWQSQGLPLVKSAPAKSN